MTWNPQLRQYEDPDGHSVAPSDMRQFIEDFISNAQSEIDEQSNELLTGAITVAAFFTFLGGLITSMHIASSLIAYGGEAEMNPERWSRVDERLSGELAYLEAFQEQVNEAETVTQQLADFIANSSGASDTREAANAIAEAIQIQGRADIVATVDGALESVRVVETPLETGTIIDSFGERIESIIWGEVESRGRQYADSVYGSYENAVRAREGDAGLAGVRRVCEDDAASCEECVAAATDEYLAFDEILDIGDTVCSGNCRCYFEFEHAGVGPLTVPDEDYA